MHIRKKYTNKEIGKLVHRLSSKSSETEFTDARVPGLKISVSKTGRISFLLRFTHNGRKLSMKLGDFGAMHIEGAVEAAWAARAKLKNGLNPQDKQKAVKLVSTFEDFVATDYLPRAMQAKKSWEDDVSKLNLRILPIFGPRLLTDIDARDIHHFIRALAALPVTPATCNRYFHLLSAIFRLAIQYGAASTNPCATIKPMLENNLRQRFLSATEVSSLMMALEQEKNVIAAGYIKFLLLTGARREEGLQAKWVDVDFERCVWTIPDTKSGKARLVPLNEAAIAVLQQLPVVPGNPFIFIGKLEGSHLVNPVKAFKRVLAVAKIKNLRLHDLRHSFASFAVNSGVSLYVVQQLLGHSNPKTTERYAHLSNHALMAASGQVANAVQAAVLAPGSVLPTPPAPGNPAQPGTP